jgi:anti-anti-sigma factor
MDQLDAAAGPEMSFAVSGADAGTVIVAIRGELDISNIKRLETAVDPIIATKPSRLVVDLRGLRFADSSAIAVWMRWATAVGRLELRDASPLLCQVITSMGLAGKLLLEASAGR